MNTFFKFLIALSLLQCSFGKPLTEENAAETPEQLSDFQKELRYLTEKNMTEYCTNRTVQIAQQTLNDPLILENHSVEVEEFKKNLTLILTKYDIIQKVVVAIAKEEEEYEEALWQNIIEPYFKLIEYYFELPEEQQTTGTKLIVETLTKYQGNEIYDYFASFKNIVKAIADAFFNAFSWSKPEKTESIGTD